MHSRTRSLLAVSFTASAFGLIVSLPLMSRSAGTLPGVNSISATCTTTGCGSCHGNTANAAGVVSMALTPSLLSVASGATVPVNVRLSGGVNTGLGGFCLQTSRGTFVAGTGTQISTTGNAITHTSRNLVNWNATFAAGTSPGLVQWTAVGLTASGSGTGGDSWGFWGPNSGVGGAPFRLYVNGPNVTPIANGCAGSGGYVPILGAPAAATIGQTFNVETYNVPANTYVISVLGLSATSFNGIPLPLDLGIAGAPSCMLRTDLTLTQGVLALGSGAGGGSVTVAWPIPNDPSLRGATLYFQDLVIDTPANTLGLTTSNLLQAVLQ